MIKLTLLLLQSKTFPIYGIKKANLILFGKLKLMTIHSHFDEMQGWGLFIEFSISNG